MLLAQPARADVAGPRPGSIAVVKVLEAADVRAWVRDVLLNPQRERPVVALSTRPRTGSTWLEPKELDDAVGDLADVVCLETGDPTWELADALPPRLDVYGGAIRVWWPGLREDSNPYDHRLFFVHSSTQARSVFDELVESIRGEDGRPSAPAPPEVSASVASISGTHIELAGGDYRGELREADIPIAELVRCLEVGTKLEARPSRAESGGGWQFSVRGLLPSPWEIAAGSLEIGDVFLGRVQSVKEFGAFVEVLPRVTGLVHISELDWSYVDSVGEFVTPGQIVPVKVLALNREGQKLELSVKRALGTDPSPLPSLVPGGLSFTWPTDEAQDVPQASKEELERRVALLTEELDAAVADRARLAETNKALRDQVQELKRDIRSSEDRFAALEQKLAPELDPLSSERALLLAVRLTYARMFDEGDRQENPLRMMRVGPSFLESLRALDGIETQKVLEVCAQVAANAAHELASREVHQLRDGSRGAGTRTRVRDQAQAWRCSLQVKTPSARRLHWWSIPGDAGATIEFASVGLHDEFSIPE